MNAKYFFNKKKSLEKLTLENYAQGFLVDDELMAGISKHPEKENLFLSFVVSHLTGETVQSQVFEKLEDALASLNGESRDWAFESLGGCGSGSCCGGGGCDQRGPNACGCHKKGK